MLLFNSLQHHYVSNWHLFNTQRCISRWLLSLDSTGGQVLWSFRRLWLLRLSDKVVKVDKYKDMSILQEILAVFSVQYDTLFVHQWYSFSGLDM